jgi:membrane fusion protein
MSALLFREEVLQAQSVQWLGSIRIARPPGFAWVTGIALVLATALVAYAVLGEVTRKARLTGMLAPSDGLIMLSAPQAGTVTELLAREGQIVTAGQPLMRLISPRLLASGDATLLNAQALAQRRAGLDTERLLAQQQARQRQDALSDRMRSLQTELRQAEAELATHRLRAELAGKSQARFEELGRSGFVSAAQTQEKHEELLDLQLRERNAQRNSEALRRDIQALQAESWANRTALATSLAQLDRSLASLSQEANENEARGGLTIAAPQAGTVSALTLNLGQTVQPGQTLLSLLPEAPGSSAAEFQAQLYAPSRTAGFVQPGQVVWLRYEAYPYQKFGMAEGRVAAVSQTPIAPQDLPQGQAQALLAAAQSNEPLYRITVNLARQAITTYGTPQRLKAGMTLEADVLQDRRAVWEWVLEPILAHSVRARGI